MSRDAVTSRLRVVFAGTPEFAIPGLDALDKSAHSIVATLTQPDRPAGRGRKLTESAVKRRALEVGLIDGIGDMRTVLRERFGDKVKLRLVSAPKRWLRRRLGLAAPVPGGEDMVGGLFDALEARALWARYGL